MKKKQITGLGTLLLVLLLGLFTTSYAYEYDITQDNYSEFFSYYNNVTWYNSTSISIVQQRFLSALNNQSNYNNTILYVYRTSNNRYVIYFYFFNNEDVTSFYFNSVTSWNLQCSNIKRISVVTNSTDTVSNIGHDSRGDYFLICNDLGNITAPYQSKSVMTFVDPQIPLTFIPKLTNTYADVWTYEDVPFYNASGDDLYLGQLLVPNTYQGYKTSTIFYWQYGTWNFKELTDYASYSVYVGSENGSSIYDIYLLRDYINENMLYDITFTDTTTEPLYTLAKCVFYIKNNYTVITNGALDPNSTFSGDYKDKYDDDLQNEQDINNISEAIDGTINNDDNVDNILSGFNSSGDILDSLGYSPIENPFTTVILDVIGQLTDVLLGSGNVTLDISAFDLDMILNSSDFTLPNGLIKNFVSLVSNGFLIWIIYKYGFKIYMMINTGKFKNLINETTNTDISLF